MSESRLISDKKLTIIRYLAAFFIPVFIIGMIYKQLEISPYGDMSILSLDLWGEYFPMYKYIFKDADSLSDYLYTWNGGLGVNNLAQSAYYCNSIFFLIFKFFPLESMITVLNVICMVKFGFTSVTCLFFLEKKLESKSVFLILGSVSYSLCAYAAAYLSQCMWTDCIIYAPLIFYGLEKLINKKKPLVYIITLALCMISSFFISYSICICLAIYFLFDMLCRFKLVRVDGHLRLDSWKEHLYTVIRFAVSSVLAAGQAAVVLLPVAKCLGNAMVSDSEFPRHIEWYNNIAEYLNAMLPSTPPSLVYGIPNISTGIFMFLLVPLYFLNRNISYREKFFSGVFLFILYVAMDTTTFNYIWHGFVYPNQLPGRWSFIVSFYVVYLAMKGLTHHKGLDSRSVLSSLIVGVSLLFISQCAGPELEKEDLNAYIISITIFAIGILIVNLLRFLSRECSEKRVATEMIMSEKFADIVVSEEADVSIENDLAQAEDDAVKNEKLKLEKKIKRYSKGHIVLKGASIACASLVLVFSVYRSGKDFIDVTADNFMKSDIVGYNINIEMLDRYGKIVDSGDSDFFRAVANSGWTFNPGMIGNYKGMSYYSSTMMGGTFKLLRYMGNRVYADMRSSVYNHGSPVQNSLFGIKYFIDRDRNLTWSLPFTEVTEEYEDGVVRENPTALPLAFAVSFDALQFKVQDEIRGIRSQNELLNKIMGEEVNVFEKVEPSVPVSAENAELGYSESWNDNYFYKFEDQTQVKIHYTYTCPKTGAYFAEQDFRAGTLKSYNPTTGYETNFDVGSDKFKYVGTFNEGEIIEVEAVIDNISVGCYGFELYSFNEERWQDCYNKLSTGGIDITSFTNTKIKGQLTTSGSNLIYTSIPQDGGWNVYCDGEKLETSVIAGTLLSFTAPSGTHEIVFKYSMPGLTVGTIITVICLIFTVFYVSPKLRNKIFGGLKRKSGNKDKKNSKTAKKS